MKQQDADQHRVLAHDFVRTITRCFCAKTHFKNSASKPVPLDGKTEAECRGCLIAGRKGFIFERSNQRDEFRRYLEGLLLPTERNKTLTGLANTEPYVGAQHPRAQGMQWFLSESNWQERPIQERRLRVLLEEASTAPTSQGVLVIDEHGDRKRGHKTAHIGKQSLAKPFASSTPASFP